MLLYFPTTHLGHVQLRYVLYNYVQLLHSFSQRLNSNKRLEIDFILSLLYPSIIDATSLLMPLLIPFSIILLISSIHIF